jgi:hypothetical protein
LLKSQKRFDDEGIQTYVSHVLVKGFINSILHVVLTLSIIVVYGGGATAVEMEHEHSDAHAPESSGSSHHHHHHDDDGSDHHHREHHDDDSEEPSEEDDSSPHRHSHVLSIDMHAVPSPAKVPFAKMAFGNSGKRVLFGELCPDGPYYELSKPPQLG